MSAVRATPRALLTTAASLALCLGLAACSTSSSKSGVNGTAPEHGGVGQPSPLLGANLSSISCGSGQLCASGGQAFESGMTGAVLALSHTAGARWGQARSDAPAGAPFHGVGCAANACLAVGGGDSGGLIYRVTSATPRFVWKAIDEPADGPLVAVGCAGTSWCLGVANGTSGLVVVTSKDAGLHWSNGGALPEGTSTVTKVTCSSTKLCSLIGTTSTGPLVVITDDAGTTFTTTEIPKKVTTVLGASCRSDKVCWVIARKDGNGTPLALKAARLNAPFFKVSLPTGLAVANDVSCVQTTCVLVGADAEGKGAAIAQVRRSKPTTLKLSFAPTALRAVSCATTMSCSAASTASLVALVP